MPPLKRCRLTGRRRTCGSMTGAASRNQAARSAFVTAPSGTRTLSGWVRRTDRPVVRTRTSVDMRLTYPRPAAFAPGRAG